jgi:hypothetical protein
VGGCAALIQHPDAPSTMSAPAQGAPPPLGGGALHTRALVRVPGNRDAVGASGLQEELQADHSLHSDQSPFTLSPPVGQGVSLHVSLLTCTRADAGGQGVPPGYLAMRTHTS